MQILLYNHSLFRVVILIKTEIFTFYYIMASLTRNLLLFCVLFGFVCFSHAQLSPNFYGSSCPNLKKMVGDAMKDAVNREARLGASVLRLFFHDCFVNVS